MADSVINTFDKGINQDISFILQPDGTYRNMKNGMLISFDGNHYTVEMTKGNKILLTLNPIYVAENNISCSLKEAFPMPIGFISFIDKLVVFSTNSESTTGYGEIGVISFTRSGLDFVGSYLPYYTHKDLNFTKLHKIEGFSFKENDKIERVYWTDNFNEPRVLDIANPIYTTYISSGSLVVGKEYMVLNGVILHDTFRYGPSNGTNIPTAPNYVNNNVFTATNTNFTTVTGAPMVIEYYPLSLLNWVPTRSLGNIDFEAYGTGNKYCGSHVYFYRLSKKSDGFNTSWSYASSPIHVGMNNEASYLIANNYANFVGNGSAVTLQNSGKSVTVSVSNIDTDFDTIELACAEFDQKTDVPYRIIITNKEDITGAEMSIEDNGGTNLGTVTIADLTLFPASILRCKTISTNKNYNIIANITEREEFELDLSGCTLTAFNYPMISHGDTTLCVNGNVPEDQSPSLVNPIPGEIKPWSRYLVTDVSGGDLTYDSITYTLGQVFVGVSGQATVTIPAGSQCRPCTTRNRYTKISDSSRTEDAIELKTAFWDYKDPAVASHNKGYWSTEKYRFCFTAFDLKGNPFYSKYIKGGPSTYDIVMPDVPSKGGLMRVDNYSSTDLYSLNPSGVKLSGLDIPESVMNQMSGFSIMRAERDPVVMAQGLLMQTILDDAPGVNQLMPLPVTLTVLSNNLPYYSPSGSLTTCVCPDYLVGTFSAGASLVVGGKVKEAFWLNGDNFKSDIDNRCFLSKMFLDQGTDANSPREMKLTSMNGFGVRGFLEGNGDVNIIGNGLDYYNEQSPVNNGNLIALDPSVYACSSVPTWPAGSDSQFTGCKKLVIFPTNFKLLGGADDYNWYGPAALANNKKIVVNFLTNTDPDNQYGGNSPAAIANTTYMSTGHFQPITNQVKADTSNGFFVGGIYDGEAKYTFNDIEIFGGDCFTNLIDHGYGLWNDVYLSAGGALSYALWFPLECNSNYNLRRGLKVSNKNMYPASLVPTGIAWNDASLTPTVQLESYSYNQGYSSQGTFIKYPSLPLNYRFTGKFEYRTRWAGIKYPGELVNSFRVFRVPDYRDLDGQRGQINNLKARDSKLFYWQDHSVGYVPILERQLVGGSALGDATALGVTGVIDRYDDIDTYFGNQHQHGLTETEYGFAWFDMRRRAFMVMGIGSKPEEISMTKGLQVFFNNEFDEGNVFYPNSNTVYNTNNLSIPEVPLMGYGIVGVYDPTFKMTYLTFKYKRTDFYAGESSDVSSIVNKDFTLGYNHILNAFVSFTDCMPAIWHNHNDLVVSANNGKNTKAYNVDMESTSYVIGDTVTINNTEYICVSPVTILSYPGTTGNTGTQPGIVGSTYWLAINQTNQIYLQNFGAELCKFYGKVWSHELEIIVNTKGDSATSPQNMQVKAIGPNWTDVYCSNDNQTSQDLNISASSRNYRLIDKSWFSNLPLPTNGRLTDYYVKVKFVFKNYVSAPTTAKNIQKVTQWIKTAFIVKK